MATFPVKYYTSVMPGAPVLANNWGDLTNLLDAVLVDGFGLKSISSLTSSAGIATATISAGHGYVKDQVVLIAGADQAAYNGEFRVIDATSTTFTFAVDSGAVSPATGASISAKVAPLNWERTFTGTNKRVFRSLNPQSNRPYLRVDNSLDPAYTSTYAKKAKVTMAEAMTNIDTFVAGAARAPFDSNAPTKNEIGTGSGAGAVDGWYKWYHARAEKQIADSTSPNATTRGWVVVGDDRGFYFFTQHDGNYGIGDRAFYAFTDFPSFRQADGYNTLLIASDFLAAANTTPSNQLTIPWATGVGAALGTCACVSNLSNGQVLMTDDTQIGANVNTRFVTLNANGAISASSQSMNAVISGYSTGIPWPNTADYSLVLHPVFLQHNSGGLRGRVPGLMFILNNGITLPDCSIVSNVTGYPGRKFLVVAVAAQSSYSSGFAQAYVALDITGPWW